MKQEANSNIVNNRDIFRVFLRSFFMQSVWNYHNMLAIGFTLCLKPIMERLYPSVESQKAFLKRHFTFFNAHPYVASFALGLSIHLEEAIAAGDEAAEKKLMRIKQLLAGTLGALGDKLFWIIIRPYSLILAAFMLSLSKAPGWQITALLIAFFMYNVPHIYIRYTGIWQGYRSGTSVPKLLGHSRFKRLEMFYLRTGTFAFLLFFAFLIAKILNSGWAASFIFITAICLAVFVHHKTKSYYGTILIVLSVAIGFGFLAQ